METVERKFWASIRANGDFIYVKTCSGLHAPLPDPDGREFCLDPTASDEELGEALLASLAASRQIASRDARCSSGKIFYDRRGRVEEEYKEWMARTMARFGYKTKRAMFKDMNSCLAESNGDAITIMPTHHVKLEAWDGDGLTKEDNVVIPADSPPSEAGAALRLALSRCLP